jgi:uncharacterized protein DUF2637
VAIDGDDRASPLAAQERGAAVQHVAAGPVARAAPARDSGRALRLLGLVAVAVGLAALTAAACALSYSSIHHLAIEAGVTRQLARIYPFIFDALLVIAGCSVLALRGAGLPSKIYAWICLLVLLGALAAGGAVQAAAVHIPRKLAAIVAAVIPWALVLIGFGLLLALLRYARIRKLGKRHEEANTPATVAAHAADNDALSDVVVTVSTSEPPRHPALPAGAASETAQQPARTALPVGPGLAGTPEPATRPLQQVPDIQQAQAGDEPATGERAPRQPPRPAVRQAEMQLRARIPRQPAEQAPGDPDRSPLMPPVGPLPAAETPEGGQQTNPRSSEHRTTGAADAADPETGSTADPADPETGSTADAADPETGSTADSPDPETGSTAERRSAAGHAPATESGTGDASAASTLNPSPTPDFGEPGEPPALKRPHSSPTPPQA